MNEEYENYNQDDDTKISPTEVSESAFQTATESSSIPELSPENPESQKKEKSWMKDKNWIAYVFGFSTCILLLALIAVIAFFTDRQSITQAETSVMESGTNITTIVYRDSGDVSDVVESVMDSVVSITSTVTYQQFNFFTGFQSYEAASSGSGIIIAKNDTTLYIATNNHVIEDTQGLTIEFSDGTSAEAVVNGSSTDTDIAIVTIPLSDISSDTLSKIKVASLHTDDDLKIGNQVIAIGNALGYGQSITVGYISALNRTIKTENGTIDGLIQTDAAINPGNSGGALINMSGEVIGINCAKYSSTEVEGVGYSIPISKIREQIDLLMQEKLSEEERGYLGIQCSMIDSETSKLYDMPRGVYVYKILNENMSGLNEKDIITAVEGRTVYTVSDLQNVLSYYPYGSNVKIEVQRLEEGEYQKQEIEVTLISKAATGFDSEIDE